METLLTKTLRSRGWNEEQFFNLPRDEQNRLLAWEHQRWQAVQQSLNDAIDRAKDDKGRIRAEVMTMLAVIELLKRI